MAEDEDENYGIDQDHAHPRAVALAPEDFFWSCIDELSPFGSDEGDTALSEFRDWRKEYPDSPLLDCLEWTIESVGEMDFLDYNDELLSRSKIKSQREDKDFDDQQYVYTLDTSVIATGFGQLVDEGAIDPDSKPVIKRAIDRLIIWAELSESWSHSAEFISNLNVLHRILKEA